MYTFLSRGTYVTLGVFLGKLTLTTPIAPVTVAGLFSSLFTRSTCPALGLSMFTLTLSLNPSTPVYKLIWKSSPFVTGGIGSKFTMTVLQVFPP